VAGDFLAVSPSGDIAVDTLSFPGSLQVFDSSGTPRWSMPRIGDLALDFAPDGSLWVAGNVNNNLDGFAPDGTSLGTMMFVVPDAGACVGLSTDANGFVSSSAGEFGLTIFRRYTWSGMLQFGDVPNDGGHPNDYDAPNALASDGGIYRTDNALAATATGPRSWRRPSCGPTCWTSPHRSGYRPDRNGRSSVTPTPCARR